MNIKPMLDNSMLKSKIKAASSNRTTRPTKHSRVIKDLKLASISIKLPDEISTTTDKKRIIISNIDNLKLKSSSNFLTK
jgi:hypothetical protein